MLCFKQTSPHWLYVRPWKYLNHEFPPSLLILLKRLLTVLYGNMQAQSSSPERVLIQSFAGSGLEGTNVNVTLHPCNTCGCPLCKLCKFFGFSSA